MKIKNDPANYLTRSRLVQEKFRMNRCDKHYVVVATRPKDFPGAYASCVDDPEFLADWAVENLLYGATLQRVTCNQGHEMLKQYMAWCEEEEKKDAVLKQTREWVAENRRKALAKPIPRNECPGCFSTIYDGAAEQGWCCDCYPKRKHYENARN